MKNTNATTTERNTSDRSCAFPSCETLLSSYTKGKFCYPHDKPEYRAIASKIEEYKNRIDTKSRQRAGSGVEFSLSYLCSPYDIVEKDGFRFLVAGKEINGIIWIERVPDLFLRFSELPEDEKAYINFAARFGILRLDRKYQEISKEVSAKYIASSKIPCFYRKHYVQKEVIPEDLIWEQNEDPFVLIIQFQRDLKRFIGVVKSHLEGSHVDQIDQEMLMKWFNWWFHSPGIKAGPLFADLRPRGIYVTHWNGGLAAALVLQLYQFLALGRVPRVCALPDCEKLTTRKKFCSTQHQKLFNTWKNRARKNPQSPRYAAMLARLFTGEELRKLKARNNEITSAE